MNSLEPRVMKRWTDDCKPNKAGQYWVNIKGGKVEVDYYCRSFDQKWYWWKNPKREVTHWLELEPPPILPEDDK